jgi:hypothetical protein
LSCRFWRRPVLSILEGFDMQPNNLPDPGWMNDRQRGAGLGRDIAAPSRSLRFRLGRVPLDDGGYDKGGAYWGIGKPLWFASNQDGEGLWLRAECRADAMSAILADRGGACFPN